MTRSNPTSSNQNTNASLVKHYNHGGYGKPGHVATAFFSFNFPRVVYEQIWIVFGLNNSLGDFLSNNHLQGIPKNGIQEKGSQTVKNKANHSKPLQILVNRS